MQSQRKFREKNRQLQEAQNQLIDSTYAELEEAEEERRQLESEHRILLCHLYVVEAMFQTQCRSSNITLAPLTEPPPSNKTAAVCSIIKDLAILLAIPQSAAPVAAMPSPLSPTAAPPAVPSTSDNVPSGRCEADMGVTSDNNPLQCNGDVKAGTVSATAAAAAPTAAAMPTHFAGVETESRMHLRSSLPSNLDAASGMVCAPTTNHKNNNATSADVVAVVQSLQTAEHFLHHHSNLTIDLSKLALVPAFPAANGNGHAFQTTETSRLTSLHHLMSSLHSLYWHTAQIKPEISVHAASASLPENTESAVEVASKLVHAFDAQELAEFRKVSRGYERQMSRVSVSVESWMERIRACVVPEEPVSSALAANVSLELVKCVSNLNAAVADGIKARRHMLENLKSKLTLDHIAYINTCAYPAMPDHVAVYTLLQEIARKIHRNNRNT